MDNPIQVTSLCYEQPEESLSQAEASVLLASGDIEASEPHDFEQVKVLGLEVPSEHRF